MPLSPKRFTIYLKIFPKLIYFTSISTYDCTNLIATIASKRLIKTKFPKAAINT